MTLLPLARLRLQPDGQLLATPPALIAAASHAITIDALAR